MSRDHRRPGAAARQRGHSGGVALIVRPTGLAQKPARRRTEDPTVGTALRSDAPVLGRNQDTSRSLCVHVFFPFVWHPPPVSDTRWLVLKQQRHHVRRMHSDLAPSRRRNRLSASRPTRPSKLITLRIRVRALHGRSRTRNAGGRFIKPHLLLRARILR